MAAAAATVVTPAPENAPLMRKEVSVPVKAHYITMVLVICIVVVLIVIGLRAHPDSKVAKLLANMRMACSSVCPNRQGNKEDTLSTLLKKRSTDTPAQSVTEDSDIPKFRPSPESKFKAHESAAPSSAASDSSGVYY